MNAFMLEESVINANIIKAAEQRESFSIVVCYVSRPMAVYGRFSSFTKFVNLWIEVSNQEFDIMLRDSIYNFQ